MTYNEDLITIPSVDYYVSYSIKGHCHVSTDEDVEYVKTLKVGDAHTFKNRDNQSLLSSELPEKLTVLSIDHDDDHDVYSVYLDHTHNINKPFDYGRIKRVHSISFTETVSDVMFTALKKWKDMIVSDVHAYHAPTLMSGDSEVQLYPVTDTLGGSPTSQSFPITFSYNHLNPHLDTVIKNTDPELIEAIRTNPESVGGIALDTSPAGIVPSDILINYAAKFEKGRQS